MGIKIRQGGQWVEVASGSGSGDSVGTIVVWAGSAASIPTSEYQLCDGSAASTSALQAITGANVPDLRDRFVVGAENTYAVDATGGSATHTLTIDEMPSHDHPYGGNNANDKYWTLNSSSTQNEGMTSGSLEFTGRNAVASQGGGQPHNNLPPYYALCYIIKHTSGSGSGGGSGTLTDVDVTQTSYTGTNPITTSESAGISTISIPSTSNAYGTRYIQTYTPTTEGNNGDVWYQVSS